MHKVLFRPPNLYPRPSPAVPSRTMRSAAVGDDDVIAVVGAIRGGEFRRG